MRLSTTIDGIFLLWDMVSALTGRNSAIELVTCHPAADITLVFRGASPEIGMMTALLAHSSRPLDPSMILPCQGATRRLSTVQRRDLDTGLWMIAQVGVRVSRDGMAVGVTRDGAIPIGDAPHSTAQTMRATPDLH